jgi:hypothetical protein
MAAEAAAKITSGAAPSLGADPPILTTSTGPESGP